MSTNPSNRSHLRVAARSVARALPSLLVLGAALLGSSAAQAQAGWAVGVPYAWSAIRAGAEADKSPLIACRATDPAYPGQHPGKTKAGWNACAFAYGGVERFTHNYQTIPPSWPAGTAQGGTIFGYDGASQLSFCRAGVGGSLQIGKHVKGVNACYIPYGGGVLTVGSYSVLTEDHFGIDAMAATIPNNNPTDHWNTDYALIGGYESNGQELYACIGSYAGGEHPGKKQKNWNACVIAYGNSEVWTQHYRVVVPRFYVTAQATGPYNQGNVLVAGTDSDGTQLGVCRAVIGGSMQLGKYRFATSKCHISYGGGELVRTSDFTTLRAKR